MKDKGPIKDEHGRTIGTWERELSPHEQGERLANQAGGCLILLGVMTAVVNWVGQGISSVLDSRSQESAEIQGLCWGGFLLHFFWCIGNRVWLPAILILVPYVNIVVWLMLLFKGNEWAWRSGEWESSEHFRRIQHRWAIAGLIFYGIVFANAIPVGIMINSNK